MEETPLLPGFRLILGISQYVIKWKYRTEKEFFDDIYEEEKLNSVRGKIEQNIFNLDQKREHQKRKILNLVYSGREICAPCTNEYYQLEVSFRENELSGYVGYSLAFDGKHSAENGDILSYIREAKPVLSSIIRYGFPNVSKEELEVFSDQEARFATQLAVWSFAYANGELKEGARILDIDNLKPKSECYPYMERVKKATRKIVEKSLDNTYYCNPHFYINPAKAKMKISATHMLAGPYEIIAQGFEISAINIALNDYSINVTDENGIIKRNITAGESIYLKMSKYESATQTRFYAYAIGSITKGRVYGIENNDDNATNYITGVCYPVILEAAWTVKWKNPTGNIKIDVKDQFGNIVQDCKCELRDAHDRKIASDISNERGIIEFNDVNIGMYQLWTLPFSEDYVVGKTGFSLEVTYGNTKQITYQLKNVPDVWNLRKKINMGK